MTLNCLKIANSALLDGEKRQGREILFRCPRHEDEHPSLSINPEKDCFLCGPCGKSGNAWALFHSEVLEPVGFELHRAPASRMTLALVVSRLDLSRGWD
jgi:hypothetical protein